MTSCAGNNASSNDNPSPPETEQNTGNVSSNQSENGPRSNVGQSNTQSNENEAAIDTLKGLNHNIDELSEGVKANTESINTLTEKVGKLKGASHSKWVSRLLGLVLLLIPLLVLVIIILNKLNSIEKRLDRLRKDVIPDIEGIKGKTSYLGQTNVTAKPNEPKNDGISSSEYITLSSKISNIERQLRMVLGLLTESQNTPSKKTISNEPRPSSQSGYFGAPIQMSSTEAYFNSLSVIQESDSRFKVEVINDHADFEPLDGQQSLDAIKSFDQLQFAVECRGCLLREANQMSVIMPGMAKKDGGRWIIIKKAVISLSK